MKQKLELETGNETGNCKQKWKCNFFSILSLVFRNQLILHVHEMNESEHQYFCIVKYLGRGNGWEWGYCTQGLGMKPQFASHTASNRTESGSRNEAARIGMLALFLLLAT